jgi:hypothetical protein
MVTDVRRHLSDLPRDEVDATLKRMARGRSDGLPIAHLAPQDYPHLRTKAAESAAIQMGGRANHLLLIEDPSPRPVPDAKLRNLDVGVFTEPSGKLSLWEVSDSGERRKRVALVDDLAGLESWASEHGEPELAGWAAKKRGATGDGLDDLHVSALGDLAREHGIDAPNPARESDRESLLKKLRSAGITAPVDETGPAKPTGPRKLEDADVALLQSATKPAGLRRSPETTGVGRQRNGRIDDLRREGYVKKEVGSDHYSLTDKGREQLARKERGGAEAPKAPTSPSGADPEVKKTTDRLQSGEIDVAEATRLLEEHGRLRQEAADKAAGRTEPGNVFKPLPLPAKKATPAKNATKAAPTAAPDVNALRTLDTEHRRDALDLRKVDELKAMLREQGLPVSGRKRDLVDRLVGHLEGDGKPAATSAGEILASLPADLTSAQKRARLRSRGVPKEQIDALVPLPPRVKASARSENFDGEDLMHSDDDETYDDELSPLELATEELDDEPTIDQIRAMVGLNSEARARELALLGVTRALGHDVTPGHDELHHYWTRGEGLAKWAESPKPWTTLVAHLTKYVGPEKAKIFASRWFIEVFHFAAGSDLNRVTHGKPPRGHRVGPG